MLTILGLILAAAAFGAHIGLSYMGYPAEQPVESYALAGLGALLGAFAFLRKRTFLRGVGAGLAVGVAGLFVAYVLHFSRLDVPEPAVKVGGRMLTFALNDSDGKSVTLTDLAGKKVVLLFYRGRWCAFCHGDLARLVREYGPITEAGAEVYAVSDDPTEASRALKEELGAKFHFLSDPGLDLVRRMGIVHQGGKMMTADTSYPLTILLDERGVVRWIHRPESLRVRTPPEVIAAEVRKLGSALTPVAAPGRPEGVNTNVTPP